MGPWLDSVTGWLTLNPQWLAAAVFIVAFVECLAIAGTDRARHGIAVRVAVLAGSGALSLSETLLLGFVGRRAGRRGFVFLGRHFHQNIRRLPGCAITRNGSPEPSRISSAMASPACWSGALSARCARCCRWWPGMFDMPFPRFFAVSLLAGAGWSVAYLLPGWATGAAIRLPLPEGFWPAGRDRRRQHRVDGGVERNQQFASPSQGHNIHYCGMSLLILAGCSSVIRT
jgi:hypothetical protein